jgi:hypothetical protein
MAQFHDKFARMVLDSYAEVHGLLTRQSDGAMFHFHASAMPDPLCRHFTSTLHISLLASNEPGWEHGLNLANGESRIPSLQANPDSTEPWEDGLKVTYDMVGIRAASIT